MLLMMVARLWPACPAEGWVTSEFGYREHPITGRHRKHRGIDVGNEEGTPIRAPWSGRVRKVRRVRDYGLYVVIDSGPLRLTMAHLSAARVKAGDVVPKGSLVGLMGHTGRATGDHLHLELRRGRKIVDPSFVFMSCPDLR
jgi:murein DD-endopeptidase MepM/ murein hydrolase activator NlpD